jgi:hypothetical protein
MAKKTKGTNTTTTVKVNILDWYYFKDWQYSFV